MDAPPNNDGAAAPEVAGVVEPAWASLAPPAGVEPPPKRPPEDVEGAVVEGFPKRLEPPVAPPAPLPNMPEPV